jgi:hypothetical protein
MIFLRRHRAFRRSLSLEEAAPHRITGAAKANGDECEHFRLEPHPRRRAVKIAQRCPGCGRTLHNIPLRLRHLIRYGRRLRAFIGEITLQWRDPHKWVD